MIFISTQAESRGISQIGARLGELEKGINGIFRKMLDKRFHEVLLWL